MQTFLSPTPMRMSCRRCFLTAWLQVSRKSGCVINSSWLFSIRHWSRALRHKTQDVSSSVFTLSRFVKKLCSNLGTECDISARVGSLHFQDMHQLARVARFKSLNCAGNTLGRSARFEFVSQAEWCTSGIILGSADGCHGELTSRERTVRRRDSPNISAATSSGCPNLVPLRKRNGQATP